MSTCIITRIGSLIAVIAAVTGVAILDSGTANADSDQDVQYLELLSKDNIRINDTATTIEWAHVTCTKFSEGESFDGVAQDLAAADHSLTAQGVGYEIGAAVKVYCPQYLSLIP